MKIKFYNKKGTLIEYERSAEGEERRLKGLRSIKARLKMSIIRKGKTPKNFSRELQKKAWASTRKEKLTYNGIHAWVRRNWGNASDSGKCELCGKENLKNRRIYWMNKDHKYTRDRNDWMIVCRKCHFKYDQKNNNVNFFGGHNQIIT